MATTVATISTNPTMPAVTEEPGNPYGPRFWLGVGIFCTVAIVFGILFGRWRSAEMARETLSTELALVTQNLLTVQDHRDELTAVVTRLKAQNQSGFKSQSRLQELENQQKLILAGMRELTEQLIDSPFVIHKQPTDPEAVRIALSQWESFTRSSLEEASLKSEAWIQSGRLRYQLNEFDAATVNFRNAISILANEPTKSATTTRLLALAHTGLGSTLHRKRLHDEATVEYTSATVAWRQTLNHTPRDLHARRHYVSMLDAFAELLAAQKLADESEKILRTAYSETGHLVHDQPDYSHRMIQSLCIQKLASHWIRHGFTANADVFLREGIQNCERMVLDFHQQLSNDLTPARLRVVLAKYLKSKSLNETAESELRKAHFAFAQQLQHSSAVANDYIEACHLLAGFCMESKRSREAETVYRNAIDVMLKSPKQEEVRDRLIESYIRLAELKISHSDYSAAKTWLEKVTQLRGSAVLPRQLETNIKQIECRISDETGDSVGLSVVIAQWAVLDQLTPQERYELATWYARLAVAVDTDKKLPDDLRSRLSNEYGAEVVNQLKFAVESGYASKRMIREDNRFTLLRDRPDFRKLLDSLPTGK